MEGTVGGGGGGKYNKFMGEPSHGFILKDKLNQHFWEKIKFFVVGKIFYV